MNGNARKISLGLILILIGLLLLARTMGIVSSDELGRLLLAVALIAGGIYMIVRKRRREQLLQDKRHGSTSTGATATGPPPGVDSGTTADTGQGPSAGTGSAAGAGAGPSPGAGSPPFSEHPKSSRDGDFSYSKILGDMFIDANGLGFENIEVSTGIGDLELRLKGARLNSNLNRVVISGFIGDIRIYVPRDMAYSATCSNFIGDIDIFDKHTSGFGNNISSFSVDYDSAERKLYIAANSFIGDIKVIPIE